MAGQPGPVQSWLNAIIMNNASQPVPVTVQNPFPWEVMGEVNVTNTEPIPIEGTVDVDGTVDVNGTVVIDDSVPVAVDVQGTVPVDVSGWLHTTDSGHVHYDVDWGAEDLVLDHLNTTGYRQITLRIFILTLNQNCEYLISYDIAGWVFRNETGYHNIYKPAPGPGFQEILVMDVISEAISVTVHNYLGPDTTHVDIYWYLTT
jgi:hypothetical protein